MSDVHRLEDDAQRYVAEVLATHGPQDLDALADNYVPPKPNDMADVKAGLRDGSAAVSNVDAKLWLIEEAIVEVNRVNDNYEVGDEEWIEEVISLDMHDPASHKYGQYRLADGVDADKLVDRRGEPLIPKSPLPDLFDPQTGLWRDNIRNFKTEDLKELRESMEQLGWLPHLPAVLDENGVVIAGHRRLEVARELGIAPVVKKITFGEGPAGEAERVALALGSNVGNEKISATDRKAIARTLYGSDRYSMEKIGELLRVSAMTISRDLSGFNIVKTETRGRPPKKPEPRPNRRRSPSSRYHHLMGSPRIHRGTPTA